MASPSSNNSWITLVPVVFLEIFFGKERASCKVARGERKRKISRKTSGTRLLPDVPINNTIFKEEKSDRYLN